MFIITAHTIHKEYIYIAQIDDRIIWTQDVDKIKIFKTPTDAATFLSTRFHITDIFENYDLAVATSIKISELIIKELY